MASLLDELKRRKVFRIAAVYVVVAWVLIQVADVVLPTFGAPEWVNRTVIFLFALGFIPTVIAAWLLELTPEGIRPDRGTSAPSNSSTALHPINFLILAIVLIMAGFQIADRFRASSPSQLANASLSGIPGASLRANLSMGELPGNSLEALVPDFSLTDDGSQLIYSSWSSGRGKIEIRDLNTGAVRTVWERLGYYPYEVRMSPDGKYVLFKRVSARAANFPMLVVLPLDESTNNALVEITQIFLRADAAWANNDQLFFQGREGALQRFSVSSGTITTINDISFTPNSIGALEVLPGHEAMLYVHNSDSRNIEIFDLRDGSRKRILEDAYAPTYLAPGYLLFMRDDSLWAIRFDISTRNTLGTAVRLISGIESLDSESDANYSLSQRGRLVYLPGELRARSAATKHLLWIDRSGNESPLDLPSMDYRYITLSPDGQRLSFTRRDASSMQDDIWTYNFDQPGIINRVTYTSGTNSVWSADGNQLFYSVRDPAGGMNSIWVVDANGLGNTHQIYRTDGIRTLLSQQAANGTFIHSQIRGLEPLRASLDALTESDGVWTNQKLVDRPFIEAGGKLSPDGRWLAYHSQDTGGTGNGVFVRPYPEVDTNRWRISSTSYSSEPQWSVDGRLHYISENNSEFTWVTESLDMDNNLRVLMRQELPLGTLAWNGFDLPNYAVSPDGERVLVSRPGPAPDMISSINRTRQINLTLVDNFTAEIEQALADQ